MKKYATQDKKFVSTMLSCQRSYPTDIIMWYHFVTIHYVTHGIYGHPCYCCRPESYDLKGSSDGNDTNTTNHDLPEKKLLFYLIEETRFTPLLVMKEYPPRTVILIT